MKNFEEYYLGLDIGTSSVGWAVCDTEYNLLKCNGKYMWGTRLFSGALTAKDRRTFRANRRRLNRRKERIKILQMLFAEEISKVDIGFYQRLKESMFYQEDKNTKQPNSLFNDINYKDKDYHTDFPTIYHLRKFLLDGNKPKDVRFLYLALHNILLHRGHFLFPETDLNNMKEITSFSFSFKNLQKYLKDEMDLDFEWKDNKLEEIENIFKNTKLSKTEKQKKLSALVEINSNKIDTQRKAIIGMMCGCKTKFANIFNNEDYNDAEINSFSFSEESYDEKKDLLEKILNEDIICIEYLKSIYDWATLHNILQGKTNISEAKIDIYNQHKKDVKQVKELLQKYSAEKNIKSEFFRKTNITDNYYGYINKKSSDEATKKNQSTKSPQERVNETLKKIIENINLSDTDREKYKDTLSRLELNLLFPKQITSSNGVIPSQLHKKELIAILENMKQYFPFLTKIEDGYSVADKIIQTFSFRIPYYIGPLNDTHDKAWLVKNKKEKIYPWNFETVVNIEKSAEIFIKNLTNKCTYLKFEDVIPKQSLLYTKFSVLNELNNLKINGERISIELKQDIYKNLFEKNKKVTLTKLKNYLKSKNYEYDTISGTDGDFKNSLGSYIDFYNILGNKMQNDDIKEKVERCIQLITIFGDEKKLLKSKFTREFKKDFTEDEIKNILSLKYKDWGKLSSKFLCDIHSYSLETGEIKNIIQLLWETNQTLMELLSAKYTFIEEIEKENNLNQNINYDDFSFESIFKDEYFSPPVKRMIWQTLLIAREIKKITKKEPSKIFIEMARGGDNKKERTDSRKQMLTELYKSIKNDTNIWYDKDRDWVKEIDNKENNQLRSKLIYLYYTQLGRCMYSGDIINFSDLSDRNIYDIDHIYPKAKTKDDSLENLVLVKKNINADKKDNYPISLEIQNKQKDFWKYLKNKKFIGSKKYERLIRKEEFTDEELAGFISRQIVETRQSTKAVAEILKKIMKNSKIVYVKAKLTSEFRQKFDLFKSRDINDYHHAHDAYLNIITGNVYNTKFTDNPINFIKDKKNDNKKYSLNTNIVFGYSNKYKNIWNPKIMTNRIKDYIYNKRPQFTRYSFEQHGGFFDQNIISKEKASNGVGYTPLKQNGVLSNIQKYGAYAKTAGTYFFLVEHDNKDKRIRTIETMPLHISKKIKNNNDILKYCEEVLKLNNPIIKIPKIKYQSLLKINGFLYNITGKSKKSLLISGAIQPIFDYTEYNYLRKLYIYKNEKRFSDEISVDKNNELYRYVLDKFQNSIYKNKIANFKYGKKTTTLSKFLATDSVKNIFYTTDINNQVNTLLEIINVLRTNNTGSDLELLGGSKRSLVLTIAKKIDNFDEIKLINQSITGLFEKEIDLKRI